MSSWDGKFLQLLKEGHKVRDCLDIKGKYKTGRQCQARESNDDAPRKNHLYALRSRGEKESSLGVVTVMLQVFSMNAYVLHDPGATL